MNATGFFPRRKADANKGDCGRVLIIAGSKGMSGAAVLCALGAVRSGAGLVRIAVPASQQSIVARRAPLEATTQALAEDKNGRLSNRAWRDISKTLREFHPDVLAVGPGLGVTPAIEKIISNLVFRNSIPIVLDADGLNALARVAARRKTRAPLVFTPHPGELARLLATSSSGIQADRKKAALRAAQKFGGVCLLKGQGTLVTDGKILYRNTTGNAGMASGGMGDMLTGIIAALWGQFHPRNQTTGFKAARAGAYLHGLAGDIALRQYPIGSLLASDLAGFIPAALKRIRK